ncbi:hypothetical protein ES705_28850 [subsurface metagenome]
MPVSNIKTASFPKRFFIAIISFLEKFDDQVDNPAGITPFVVIP